MGDIEQIKRLLAACTPDQRRAVFDYLRGELDLHPLERALHARAEVVLEAIEQAGGLTLRMLRGVIAGAAFNIDVADRLAGWERVAFTGDRAYDALLRDSAGEVTVQVKLQRSLRSRPWTGRDAPKYLNFADAAYVVETQKTRKGKKGGADTRPYRFGEFDLLAVSLYPVALRWDRFRFTVGRWLLPDPADPSLILKYQPVAPTPNDDWTDDFVTAASWLRSGTTKVIGRG